MKDRNFKKTVNTILTICLIFVLIQGKLSVFAETELSIKGNDVIQSIGEQEYYLDNVTDNIKSIEWSLQDSYSGITLQTTDNQSKISLLLEEGTINGDIYICAKVTTEEIVEKVVEKPIEDPNSQIDDKDSISEGQAESSNPVNENMITTTVETIEEIVENTKTISLKVSIELPVVQTYASNQWDGSALTVDANYAFSGGTGDVASPYEIANSYDLAMLKTNLAANISYTGKFFIQTADVDLQNFTWSGIGATELTAFSANYDGQSYAINNLKIDSLATDGSANYKGLFGYVKNATIQNINVASGSINLDSNRGKSYVGGIVGYVGTTSTIKNCTVNLAIDWSVLQSNGMYVGGIVGYGQVTIEDCTNQGSITFSKASTPQTTTKYGVFGGIAGQIQGSITRCTNLAPFTYVFNGSFYYGGVVGSLTGDITDCVNKGTITYQGALELPNDVIGKCIGGIVGDLYGTFQNCTNYGDLTIHDGAIGGIINRINENVEGVNSFNYGDFVILDQGYVYLGGIAYSSFGSSLKNCGNYGDISTTNEVYLGAPIGGMLAEEQVSSLDHCFNTGNITIKYTELAQNGSNNIDCAVSGGIATTWAGGGTMINCFNRGNIMVTGNTASKASIYLSGLVNELSTTTKMAVVNCYNSGNLKSVNMPDTSRISGILNSKYSSSSLNFEIKNCFNIGELTSSGSKYSSRSGVAMPNTLNVSIENNYYTAKSNHNYTSITTIANEIDESKVFASSSAPGSLLYLMNSFVDTNPTLTFDRGYGTETWNLQNWKFSKSIISSHVPVEKSIIDEVAKPVATPDSGEVSKGTNVELSCATPGATIYYTTDGTTPTEASNVYTTGIIINDAMTIKAYAVMADMQDSTVASFTYTVTTIKYIVTFNSDGGTSIANQEIINNSKVVKPIDPTKEGYDFVGWYKESTLTIPWDFANDMVNNNVTLYAKWQPKEWTIAFDSNGGSGVTSSIVKTDQKITKPTNPTKAGYDFVGWYKESTLTSSWNFANDTVNNNVTLYAKWQPKEWTITFDSNGGSGVTSSIVKTDQKITKPTNPTKAGYDFVGWYKDSTLATPWDFANDTVNNNVTLYAKWQPKEWTITFDSNGGSSVTSSTVKTDQKITKPTNPTKEGYDFVGWYKESTLTTSWNFANDTVNSNTTLYAKWIAIPYYVTFNSHGGNYTPDKQSIKKGGMAIKPTDPQRKGYTFIGWTTDLATNDIWNFDTIVSKNMTLHAVWKKITEADYVKRVEVDTPAGAIKKGTEISLSVATAGAKIYYTVDGSEPTSTSKLYTGPITINDDCVIKAFASKEGMFNSPVSTFAYTIKTTGDITIKVDVNDSEVGCTIPDDDTILDAILTPEDKLAYQTGNDITITLDCKTIEIVNENIDQNILQNHTVGKYLDISIYKKIGDQEAISVHNLNSEIEITIDIPSELLPAQNIVRTYKMLRVHDNDSKLLDDKDQKLKTITISTDRFSTYILVYKDIVQNTPVEDTINTNDTTTNISAYFVMMCGSIALMITLKRRWES